MSLAVGGHVQLLPMSASQGAMGWGIPLWPVGIARVGATYEVAPEPPDASNRPVR